MHDLRGADHPAAGPDRNAREAAAARLSSQETANEVRCTLWNKVGIIRNGKDLCDALRRLNSLLLVRPAGPSSQFYEARNILEVGKIITQRALAREESRGAHYRSDFPLKNEATPAKHSFTSKDAPVFFT